MSDFKNKLVWSDDPKDKLKLEKPKEVLPSASEVEKTKWTCVFRLEKNGRGGKTVTVIDQLPRSEEYVSALCKELKSKCGSGGTYEIEKDRGVIEIQGDKRVAIKALFDKKGIRYKGM
jgi:translation initiation factor 1